MKAIINKYLNYSKKCIDSKIFRNYFIVKNNKKIDLLQNGKLSCAKFVSEVLLKFKLIEYAHLRVVSCVKDMNKNNWKKVDINNLELGDVLVWDKNKSGHYHMGFYIGNKRAISNSEKYRCPREHHFTYMGKRKIIKVLRYKK
ncbi:MAG TPA: NlpC/P60 family protein [bacterium]|jgi:hypothetical protein|nr:NlpC/P60 family protein [bacterium]HOG38381.1 NlpC/P60 family protein [bacterium]HQI03339.1 NlpC/P60 family protein [bacterium]